MGIHVEAMPGIDAEAESDRLAGFAPEALQATNPMRATTMRLNFLMTFS